MIGREDVATTRSIAESGLDSLVSIELRNWIQRQLSVDLAMTQTIGAANLLQAQANQTSDHPETWNQIDASTSPVWARIAYLHETRGHQPQARSAQVSSGQLRYKN